MYDNKINNDRPARSHSLVDPSMSWKEALNIIDNMVRLTLLTKAGKDPNWLQYRPLALNCKSYLDHYSSNQLISAWIIVSRGYSDSK